MLTDVMLCISFVAGIGIMYVAVLKFASIMEKGFVDEEAEAEEKTVVMEKKTEEKPEEDKGYREGIKPRISLRTHPRKPAGRNNVLVGNGRPYRINMKKV